MLLRVYHSMGHRIINKLRRDSTNHKRAIYKIPSDDEGGAYVSSSESS